jgi:hypothetical protein
LARTTASSLGSFIGDLFGRNAQGVNSFKRARDKWRTGNERWIYGYGAAKSASHQIFAA